VAPAPATDAWASGNHGHDLVSKSRQPGFNEIFELRSLRLRNYPFIYRRSPATHQSVLDFPAQLNMSNAHL
jgi:hypothetical protein